MGNPETTELVEVPPSQEDAVMNSLTAAIDKGVDADSLEKILDMQERILDRAAKQSYVRAMVAVQKRLPDIKKAEYNQQTQSTYESLEAMNRAIKPIYADHGFNIEFGTEPANDVDMITIIADVSHVDGFTKRFSYPLPYDMTGIKGSVNKTKIHASGSTLKYGRRYLLKLIFNLTTADDVDDDGNDASFEVITDQQLSTLRDLINATESVEAEFCKFCKVDSLENLSATKYDHAYNALKAKLDGL